MSTHRQRDIVKNPAAQPISKLAHFVSYWGELKDRWAELRLDAMDPKDMEQFVYEILRTGLDDLTATESVRQFEDEFDRETVDQVIRDVTSPGCQRIGSVV